MTRFNSIFLFRISCLTLNVLKFQDIAQNLLFNSFFFCADDEIRFLGYLIFTPDQLNIISQPFIMSFSEAINSLIIRRWAVFLFSLFPLQYRMPRFIFSSNYWSFSYSINSFFFFGNFPQTIFGKSKSNLVLVSSTSGPFIHLSLLFYSFIVVETIQISHTVWNVIKKQALTVKVTSYQLPSWKVGLGYFLNWGR